MSRDLLEFWGKKRQYLVNGAR